MISGMTSEGGLPGLPCWVTRLAGIIFCYPGSACITRKCAPNANLLWLLADTSVAIFSPDSSPSSERRNAADEDESGKENAEKIQASGEGLRKFTAINNNTTSTSTEASSYALPDHSKGTWPAR